MLIGISNFALIQIIQALAIIFFIFLIAVVVNIRHYLPRSVIIDIIMCLLLLVYAASLRINLST